MDITKTTSLDLWFFFVVSIVSFNKFLNKQFRVLLPLFRLGH